MGFYCPIEFKDNLRTIEPRFPKNLRTNEARLDFTGPYKKKCTLKEKWWQIEGENLDTQWPSTDNHNVTFHG